MNINELDGKWRVVESSNIHDLVPGYHDFGDALVEIKGGVFKGHDNGGMTWFGTIEKAQDGLLATVTVDPSTGVPDAVVLHPDGLKRAPITHKVRLSLTKIGVSVRLDGELRIGAFHATFCIRPEDATT